MPLPTAVVGEIARLLVSAELLSRGYSVSKPEADVGYDVVSISPAGSTWRLQIKARTGYPQFSVRRRHGASYAPDADAFVFVSMADAGTRYCVVPVAYVGDSRKVSMTRGNPWLGAWHVLDKSPCPLTNAVASLRSMPHAT
jgi:hypothetical protein